MTKQRTAAVLAMAMAMAAVAVAVAVPVPVAAEERARAPEALEQRVREFEAAFTAHDAKAISAMFAPDAVFINPRGEQAEGREQIAARLGTDFKTVLQGVRAHITIERVRMINPELSFLDVRQELTGGSPPPGVPTPWVSHGVVLARKDQGGAWSILELRPYFFIPARAAAGGTASGAAR
jgi:uncharacterized protein (TIGR02246 family)